MLGTPFYHSSTRKVVAVFGNLFNDIHVIRTDDLDAPQQDIKVPLSYAPKNTWYAKLREDYSSNDPNTNLTLPRMSFEMLSLTYDPNRKISTLGKQIVSGTDPDNKRMIRNEVPYNIDIELNIASKNIEDALQIVEQILPWFQPDFNVPIKLNDEFSIIKDVPFILNSVTPDDPYEQGFEQNRLIVWTLSFTAKSWMLFPIVDAKVIKTAILQIADNIEENGDWGFDVELTSEVDPLTAQEEDAWTIKRTKTEL